MSESWTSTSGTCVTSWPTTSPSLATSAQFAGSDTGWDPDEDVRPGPPPRTPGLRVAPSTLARAGRARRRRDPARCRAARRTRNLPDSSAHGPGHEYRTGGPDPRERGVRQRDHHLAGGRHAGRAAELVRRQLD